MKALSILALIQRPYRGEGFDYISFDPIKLVAVINKNACRNRLPTPMTTMLWRRCRWCCCTGQKIPAPMKMLMDLFRKSGVSAKVIMHITQPGVILDWLEDELEAATLLPSSEVNAEKLPHCYVVDVFPHRKYLSGSGEIAVDAVSAGADGYYRRGYPLPRRGRRSEKA